MIGPKGSRPISNAHGRSQFAELRVARKPQKRVVHRKSQEPSQFGKQPINFVPKEHTEGHKTGVRCNKGGNYMARWVTGAALMPQGDRARVLITYINLCVYANGPQFFIQGWGFEIYNWKTNSFEHGGPIDVVKPRKDGRLIPTKQMMSAPIFANGNLYLFSTTCSNYGTGTCGSGGIHISTVPDGGRVKTAKLIRKLRSMDHRFKPQQTFNTGSQGDGGPLVPVPSVTQVRDGTFALMIQTTTAGKFSVYTAPRSRPKDWSHKQTSGIAGCNNCRAFIIHGEASKDHDLVMTYYDANAVKVAPVGKLVFAPKGTARY